MFKSYKNLFSKKKWVIHQSKLLFYGCVKKKFLHIGFSTADNQIKETYIMSPKAIVKEINLSLFYTCSLIIMRSNKPLFLQLLFQMRRFLFRSVWSMHSIQFNELFSTLSLPLILWSRRKKSGLQTK